MVEHDFFFLIFFTCYRFRFNVKREAKINSNVGRYITNVFKINVTPLHPSEIYFRIISLHGLYGATTQKYAEKGEIYATNLEGEIASMLKI